MAGAEGIYRRVSVRLWADEKVGRLTPLQPSGQALWLYLLTGPHTGPIPGVFVTGRAAIAEALGWEVEDFDRCAAELLREGLVQFDRAARLWFIPNAVRHNPPASPNVVIGWRTHWTMLPECPMRDQIADQIAASLEATSKACAEAFKKASGKASGKASDNPLPHPLANQEQEQHSGNRIQETADDVSADHRPVQAEATTIAPPADADAAPPVPLMSTDQPARATLLDPKGFAEFWSAWPATGRKQDRKKCAEKWKRQNLATVLPKILAHIAAMKETPTWREGFEPAPLTYLNGERWQDGMPPPDRDRASRHPRQQDFSETVYTEEIPHAR